jgi:hypothetical protein
VKRMILLLFVRASVGTAEAVPFPVIRSVIFIAALKRCATQTVDNSRPDTTRTLGVSKRRTAEMHITRRNVIRFA